MKTTVELVFVSERLQYLFLNIYKRKMVVTVAYLWRLYRIIFSREAGMESEWINFTNFNIRKFKF